MQTNIFIERTMRFCASLLIAFFSATGVFASVRSDTLREVVAESRRPEHSVSLSSTSPSESVSAVAMKRLGLRGVSDVLRLMGGISVRDYGGLGGMKTVSVRGLSPHHTAVLLDGLPVSNSQAGQIDLSRFATYNMESLRLHIGGPSRILAPALLGAYSGSVAMESHSEGCEAVVEYGSWNTLSADFSSPWASVLYNHTDGDYPFTLSNGQHSSRLHRDHGRVDALQAALPSFLRWTSGPSCSFSLRSSLQGYYSHRELPGSVVYYTNEGTEQLWDLNLSARTRLEGMISEKWSLVAGLQYNYGWNKYFDAALVTDGSDGTSRYRQNEYYLTAGLAYRPLRSLSLALVHDGQWSSLRTNLTGGEQPDRWISWNALRVRYRTSRLNIEGELLATVHRLRETSGLHASPSASCRWTPSLAASVQPWATQSFFVRASWRKSFRLPSFNDLYYYRLGNHDLRPEQATETNVGLTWGHESETWKTELTADFYFNRVTDKIVAFPTTFAWRMTNFGRVDILGLDLGGNMEWRSEQVSVNAVFHISCQDARDRTDSEDSFLATPSAIPYTPAVTGNASLSCVMPWVSVGWTLNWMGRRYSNVIESDRYRLDPFAEHGFSLSRVFYLKGVELIPQASLLNAFDSHFEIVQYYPMPGRHWRLGLTARF